MATLQDLLSSRSLESQVRIQEIADILLLDVSKKEKAPNTQKADNPKNN